MSRDRLRVSKQQAEPLALACVDAETVRQRVAENIRRLRAERPALQAAIAEAVGMDARQVSNIESGKTNLYLWQAVAIAEAFGVDYTELIREE